MTRPSMWLISLLSLLRNNELRKETRCFPSRCVNVLVEVIKLFLIPSLQNNVVHLSIFLQQSTKRHVSAPIGPSSYLLHGTESFLRS